MAEERRCKECGDVWFMVPGDELCRDCRRWQYEQTEAGVRQRVEAARTKKPKDDAPQYQKRK